MLELSKIELLYLRKQVVISIENAERRLARYRRFLDNDDVFGEKQAIAESEYLVMTALLSRINDEIAKIVLGVG